MCLVPILRRHSTSTSEDDRRCEHAIPSGDCDRDTRWRKRLLRAEGRIGLVVDIFEGTDQAFKMTANVYECASWGKSEPPLRRLITIGGR